MKKPDYSYQGKLIDDAYQSLVTGPEGVVLAACPGAGKTVMGIRIIERYLKQFPDARVLILTHGQLLLRNQWIERFSDHTSLKPSEIVNGKEFLSTQVIVGLPQTYRRIIKQVKNVDLLVVDEAHHFYYGTLIQSILKHVQPRHELLLTGTPSLYIDDPKWKIVSITLQELLAYGSICDPEITLWESEYDFKLSDYNSEMVLKKEISVPLERTKKLIMELIPQLPPVSKALLVCRSVAQGRMVLKTLRQHLKQTALLSVSEDTEGSIELAQFKSDPTLKFLIVVNRGVLGFDFSSLELVVDLTVSLNINRIFQMLCRIVRPNGNAKKYYIKVSPKELMPVTYFVMSFVVALSDPKYYLSYKGKTHDLPIPIKEEFASNLKRFKSRHVQFPLIPRLLTFKEMKDINQGSYEVKRIAYTNFKTVKESIYGSSVMTLSDAIRIAKSYNTRTQLIKSNYTAYRFLLDHSPSTLDEMYGRPQGKIEYSEAIGLAKSGKFKNKSEFRANCATAHDFLQKHHRQELDDIFGNIRWTYESAVKKLKECKTILECRRTSAFVYLHRTHQMTPEVQKLIEDRRQRAVRTPELCLQRAREARIPSEFYIQRWEAFLEPHPQVKKQVEEILDKKKAKRRPQFDLKTCIEIAKQCKTRTEWRAHTASKWVKRNNKEALLEKYVPKSKYDV